MIIDYLLNLDYSEIPPSSPSIKNTMVDFLYKPPPCELEYEKSLRLFVPNKIGTIQPQHHQTNDVYDSRFKPKLSDNILMEDVSLDSDSDSDSDLSCILNCNSSTRTDTETDTDTDMDSPFHSQESLLGEVIKNKLQFIKDSPQSPIMDSESHVAKTGMDTTLRLEVMQDTKKEVNHSHVAWCKNIKLHILENLKCHDTCKICMLINKISF